jgi:hypothetical protein
LGVKILEEVIRPNFGKYLLGQNFEERKFGGLK